MAAAPDTSLAEKLRAQIARMVDGNGLPPEAVTTQSAHEIAVKLDAQSDVRLVMHPESTQGKGTQPARWQQNFNTIAELGAAAPALSQQLTQDKARLQHAADYILHQPQHGWGQTATEIPVSELNFVAGAIEICAQCRGEKFEACAACNGQRRQECNQCQGRREITCPSCLGRGALASGEDCTACLRRGVIACPACQGQGNVMCVACGGHGQIPCRACDAKGQLWQQIIFHAAAQTSFKMAAPELPEDIALHLRRLRPENLLDGRAKISVGDKEFQPDFIRIHYVAEFPLAQFEFQVADQPAQIILLGEKPVIWETTHFMDYLLAPSLDLLRRARAREVLAATALTELGKIRFYREALSPGKNSAELRRRYPFGIGANLLREVPRALQYLLGILTAQPRMLAAIAFNAAVAMLLLYLYLFNPGTHHFDFNDVVLGILLLALNAVIIIGTHIGVSAQTLRPFGVRPKLDLKYLPPALGDYGLISLAATAALCLMAWII